MISILINILEALLLFAFSNGIYRIYNKGLSHKSRGQQLRRYLIASLVTMIPYYFVGSYWSAAMLTALFVAVLWICTYNILYDKTYKKMLKEYAKTYGFEDGDAMEKAYSKDTLKEAMLTDLVKDWLVDNCIQKTDN